MAKKRLPRVNHTSKRGVFCVTMGSHCLISKQTSSDYKLTKAHTKSRLFCDKQIYKCNLYLGEYFALACKSFFIELDFVITWIVIRQWESIVTQKTPLFELWWKSYIEWPTTSVRMKKSRLPKLDVLKLNNHMSVYTIPPKLFFAWRFWWWWVA